VTFYPDVFAVAMLPASSDPASVGVWRLNVFAWNPNIGVAVPTVIAGVPGPIAVLRWGHWNDFAWTRWRADGDVDLSAGTCGSYSEKKGACCGEKLLLHEAFSLETAPD
jgi:hypothetical protein